MTQYAKCTEHICPRCRSSHCNVHPMMKCSPCLMYGVVNVDVDIVQQIVILVPVSAPFALKTLELTIATRRKKYVKIIFH